MRRVLRTFRWRWQHRRRAFALRSATYLDDSDLVGLFRTRRAAERYAAEAVPPVTDARIEEWAVAA